MALTCLQCMPVEKPEIIVIEKNPRAPLCDVHGVAKVNIVERMDFVPTEEQLRGYYESQREVEVAAKVAETPKTQTEIAQEKEDASEEDAEPATLLPEGITATFAEVDNMNSAELAIMCIKLGITFQEGEYKSVIRESIKKALVK